MKFFKRILCLTLSVIMISTMFVGCKKDDEKVKLRLSEVTHSVFYAPQYVAINKGFFEEEGIEIELSVGEGADKVMAAVLSGSIDIGLAGPEACIYVYNEGKENYPRVFGQLTQKDGSFLMGREKVENFDWNSLKGTTLLPGRKGGVPYMTLEYVVKSKGLVPGKDVIFDDSIQFALMAGAFTSGTGDFVTLFEPTASMLEKEGKGYILASVGEEAGEIPFTAYFASQDYMKKNPEIIKKFLRAIYKGQKWVMENSPEEVAKAMEPSFPDTDLDILTTVVERYKEIDAWSKTPVMKKEAFEKLQEVITMAGELDKKAVFEDVVDNSFAEEIIK
ncbi:MAG: ABC transporter substrate-binding protein [Clostridia bacterium]|nr:ABC transporter substrate-binding protein [Clostridia bacterium]